MALILDGTSPTGAWSMFRDLLTSFVGGTRYTTATGVNSLADQTGNSLHMVQGNVANQPAVTTAGPNSRTCFDCNGTSTYLRSSAGLGNYISNSTGYIVVSFIADAITLNAAASYSNNAVIGTASNYMGIVLKNTGTPATIMSWNWDGTDDHADIAAAITVGTPYVAEWRHEGGNVYLRLNGGTEVSAASGDTAAMPANWYLGASNATFGDIKVFEAATYSTVPSLATRNAIVADFMAQHTAVTDARATQVSIEQWGSPNPPAQVTQAALEMWASTSSTTIQALATLVGLEMWANVPPIAPAGRAKVWNGSAWVIRPAKAWNGSAWVAKPVKIWNGSAWV